MDLSLDEIISQRNSGKAAGSSRVNRANRRRAAAPYASKPRRNNNDTNGFSGSAKKRVYVGNLSWDVSWQDLKDHMRQAGDVEFVDVLTYSDGRSSGGGIVQYSSAKEAQAAIRDLTDSDLKGRLIFVREDREQAGVTRGNQGNARVSNGNQSNVNGGATVYVGNLSWDVSWQDLKDHMRLAGEVTHADVMMFPDGRSKGCGLVTYASAKEARAAIRDLTDTDLNGRLMFVREDREGGGTGRSQTGDGGSRGSRGSRGGGGGSGGGGARSDDDEVSVYVGNLSWDTSWQSLKDAFADYGCLHADIGEVRDGRTRGFGIIKFAGKRDANRAIREMNETELDGRQLFVRYDEQ